MSVTISWAKKVQLAKCDISVGFPKSSHIWMMLYYRATSYVALDVSLMSLPFYISGNKQSGGVRWQTKNPGSNSEQAKLTWPHPIVCVGALSFVLQSGKLPALIYMVWPCKTRRKLTRANFMGSWLLLYQ